MLSPYAYRLNESELRWLTIPADTSDPRASRQRPNVLAHMILGERKRDKCYRGKDEEDHQVQKRDSA